MIDLKRILPHDDGWYGINSFNQALFLY